MTSNAVYLIVLYNHEVQLSNAYQSLKKENIIIFDNSDNEKFVSINTNFCNQNNIIYLTNNKNVGNSKAYNLAFEYILNNLDVNYVVISDSDTVFGREYIDTINNLAPSNKFYLPLIRSVKYNKVVFPIQKTKWKSYVGYHRVDNVVKLETINSGLVLATNIIKDNKYDERFFVYCSDFEYVDRIRKKYDYEILNIENNQDFFDHSTKYTQNTIKQMEIRLSDEKKYLSSLRYILFRNSYIWEKFFIMKKVAILKLLFKVF